MYKIICLSDLHGYLPEIPDCDLLLLAGDYSPHPKSELGWLETQFKPWINKLSEKMKIIGCAGNHDIAFQQFSQLIPKMNWTYLEDELYEWNGIRFYGSPWQPRFYDWAFNLEEHELEEKWKLIPECDILITHGPPYGIMDFSLYGHKNVGSPSLRNKVMEIKPKLHVFGHIHFSYGITEFNEITFVNASHVGENYNPDNPLIEFYM